METIRAVESMKQIEYPNFKIIVVDNFSTDESLVNLKNANDIVILRSKKNGGLNHGYNIGIDYALLNGADFVFVTQNDSYDYSHNILDVIRSVFESDDKIGMVGPAIKYPNGKYRWSGEEKNKMFLKMSISEGFVFKRAVLETIGKFNERLIVYFEDMDLIIRLRKAGYKTRSAENVSFIHTGQSTFSKQKFYPNYIRVRNIPFMIRRYAKDKPLKYKIGILIEYLGPHFLRIKKSLRHLDFVGVLYTLLGISSGLLVGSILPWKEELPWQAQNVNTDRYEIIQQDKNL
jgi:GT2 family glycosyltransferase